MRYQQVAMMTRLHVEMPQMTKQDDAATQAVNAAFGASGAGIFRKHLYPPHLIEPITAATAGGRAYLRTQTRPISMSDFSILPNRRIMTYLDMMGRHELNFWQTVTAFLNNWAQVLYLAKQQQGNLFNPGEYPDVSSIKAQFRFEYPIVPIGNVRDTVLDELDEASQSVIVAKAQADERAANEAIVRDAVADLREQVLRIINQTTIEPKVNKKGAVVERSKKIYDSLTGDIRELIGVLQDLGAGEGNPVLQDVLDQADMHLTIPADALRGNPDVCRITNDKAAQILKAMEAFT